MSTIVNGKSAKEAKPKKIYYSARGGARSKGADITARSNVFSPPPTVLETPLPRDTSSHYLRGGTGNEWDYVVEEGVFERALAHDQQRLQELKWHEFDHKISRTGLRGGARIPKKKDPAAKKSKPKGLAIFRKRAASLTAIDIRAGPSSPSSPTSPKSSIFSLSSFPERDFAEKPLEQRLYELSIASTDDAGSIAFSNFTAPTFMLSEEDGSSLHSSSIGSIASTIGESRARSLSLSTVNTVLWTPETSPVDSHGQYSLIQPGILVFKPEEAQPLDLKDTEDSELSIGRHRALAYLAGFRKHLSHPNLIRSP